MKHLSTLQMLLALLATLSAPAASMSAVSEAKLFMRNHVRTPPNTDELAELKGANPEAYALVKALLMKRSLGLLDPKDPSARFAGASQQPQHPPAPEATQQDATPVSLEASHQEVRPRQVAVPYADVGAVHHDWMNWKPQDSAMNDETMVQNVLGAVAELKGKKVNLMSKNRASSESLPATDEQSSNSPSEAAVAVAKPSTPQVAPHENSYLKSIDLGLSSPEVPKPSVPAKPKNSYLDGLDLTGDMPKVVGSNKKTSQTSQTQKTSTNYLAAFSWDDSKQQEEEHQRPKEEATIQPDSKNTNLLSWLGVVNKQPVHETAPVAPSRPSNPYLVDLS